MDKGVVYKVISPNNKSYIGQVVNFLKNGEEKGFKGRWKQHTNSALGSNPNKGCRILNKAIIKYGESSFKKEILMTTTLYKLDLFEELFIKTHNPLVPNGYNLQSGGTNTTHSKETCKKRSKSLKKLLEDPEKRKVWSDAKKGKPHKQRDRKRKEDNGLPKYLLHYKSGKYEGYEISCHPYCKSKKFTKSKLTMDEKLKEAITFMESLKIA